MLPAKLRSLVLTCVAPYISNIYPLPPWTRTSFLDKREKLCLKENTDLDDINHQF